ncbi:hypothetical protein pb186bvf_001603 [Paramecium bursaria]
MIRLNMLSCNFLKAIGQCYEQSINTNQLKQNLILIYNWYSLIKKPKNQSEFVKSQYLKAPLCDNLVLNVHPLIILLIFEQNIIQYIKQQ